MALTTAQIQQAYVTFFSRPADPAGLNYWSSYAGSVADLYATFAKSTEYSAAFTGLSSAQQVNVVYQNLFGRDAEATGLLYWAKQIDAGAITVANLALAVSAGAQTTDAAVVANRVTAATSFTAALDTTAEILGYSGTTANAAAKTWLSSVKDTAASLTAATTGVDAAVAGTIVGGGAAGSTFTLTTGADIVTGTAANDTINADVSYTDAATPVLSGSLSILDSIVGGTGADVLNLTVQGGGAAAYTTGALPAATISGVETLNIRAVQGEAADIVTLDASSVPGLTAINSDRSSSAVTLTNVASGAQVGIVGNNSVTNGALTAGYATAATAAVLNVSGVTKGTSAITINGSGVTSTTINSTGGANTIGAVTQAATSKALVINATTGLTTGAFATGTDTTVTISGAAATGTTLAAAHGGATAAVKLGALTAGVTTIDASGMTAGGVSLALVAANTSFKGGQGTDVITTVGLTSTAANIIDAGAGTDTLIAAAYADINTAAKAKQYANFEILDSGTLTATAIDMSLFTNSTITGLRAGGADSIFSNVTAAQAANVTVYAGQGTSTTVAIKDAGINGQIDTLNLTFSDGLAAVNTITSASVVAVGTENINIVATDNAVVSLMTGSTSWTNSTISGAGTVSLTTGALALNANTTIDASSNTGGLTFVGTGATANGIKVTGSATKANSLTGAALADVLIGGAGNDTITGAAGANILTGGGGADSFVIASTGAVPSASSYQTITDFSKTAGASTFDTISAAALVLGVQTAAAAAGVATITGGVATFNAADTTFAQHLAAVAAALQLTAGATAIWQEGADAYVYIADNTLAVANTDVLVKLVGVTAGALTVAGNAITAMA